MAEAGGLYWELREMAMQGDQPATQREFDETSLYRTLTRLMLEMTPAGRLEMAQSFADALCDFYGGRYPELSAEARQAKDRTSLRIMRAALQESKRRK